MQYSRRHRKGADNGYSCLCARFAYVRGIAAGDSQSRSGGIRLSAKRSIMLRWNRLREHGDPVPERANFRTP